jgi:hypothetical protein
MARRWLGPNSSFQITIHDPYFFRKQRNFSEPSYHEITFAGLIPQFVPCLSRTPKYLDMSKTRSAPELKSKLFPFSHLHWHCCSIILLLSKGTMGPSSMPQDYLSFFNDQVVFLTGATGGLGGCILFKLASQLPTKKVYILCRSESKA